MQQVSYLPQRSTMGSFISNGVHSNPKAHGFPSNYVVVSCGVIGRVVGHRLNGGSWLEHVAVNHKVRGSSPPSSDVIFCEIVGFECPFRPTIRSGRVVFFCEIVGFECPGFECPFRPTIRSGRVVQRKCKKLGKSQGVERVEDTGSFYYIFQVYFTWLRDLK